MIYDITTPFAEKTLEQDYLKFLSAFGSDKTDPISERNYILWLAAKEASLLEGDMVECGVYQGNSAAVIASTCRHTLHLFDSFEGISELSEFDNDFYKNNKFISSKATAEATLKKYGEGVKIHAGWIPSTLNEIYDVKVSFVHVDLSLYQPTSDAINFFWNRMVDNGIMMFNFHDGYSTGPEKAVREFFEGKRDITVLPTGVVLITK